MLHQQTTSSRRASSPAATKAMFQSPRVFFISGIVDVDPDDHYRHRAIFHDHDDGHICSLDSGWYFMTREEVHGPFLDKVKAYAGAMRYRQYKRFSPYLKKKFKHKAIYRSYPVFFAHDGWYFSTREGVHGPFNEKTIAVQAATTYQQHKRFSRYIKRQTAQFSSNLHSLPIYAQSYSQH